MRRHWLVVLVLAGCLGVLGCGSARRGEPLVGPLPIGSSAVAQGRQVFMAHCQPCHPGGEAGLGPAINDKLLPGFLITLQVRSGLGAMPAFSPQELSPDELDALIAYLKVLRRQG